MDINLAHFNTDIGRQKPENIIHSDNACPFCATDELTDIIATDGDIILLKNKYNVIEEADQFVLIEGKDCDADIPNYTSDHMRRLIAFGMEHWSQMRASGKYDTVLFFKNYGPYSGGTIRHPHMQLVGFGELNIVPDDARATATIADYIQIGVDFIKNAFRRPLTSYNIFFYNDGADIFIKIMPRFATSPVFIGYNIRLLPSNLAEMRNLMRAKYFEHRDIRSTE